MAGFWTSTNQRYAYNYLRQAGLSNFGAAGLVARWAYVESTAVGPRAVNPYSGAFGIAQWLGSRLTAIRGNTSFEAQLAYAVKELNSTEARAGNMLRNATSALQGAVGASIFERAEGYNAQTGRDNWTDKTLRNIPGVLAVAGGAQNVAPPQVARTEVTAPHSTEVLEGDNDNSNGSSNVGPLVILTIAGIGLYLWMR